MLMAASEPRPPPGKPATGPMAEGSGRVAKEGRAPPPEGKVPPNHSEIFSIDWPPRSRPKTSSHSSGRTRAAKTWSLDRWRWRRVSISVRRFSFDWRTGISYTHSTSFWDLQRPHGFWPSHYGAGRNVSEGRWRENQVRSRPRSGPPTFARFFRHSVQAFCVTTPRPRRRFEC